MPPKLMAILAGIGIFNAVFPQQALSADRVGRDITRQVERYANAIACPGVHIERRMSVALPSSGDHRVSRRFVVLWEGDIGCSGGSGSQETHLAAVFIGAGNAIVVDPLQSSPAIRFESPVRVIDRIVSHTGNTLTLEGKELGPSDAECCPSIPIRFTLRADHQGHWLLASKTRLTTP